MLIETDHRPVRSSIVTALVLSTSVLVTAALVAIQTILIVG